MPFSSKNKSRTNSITISDILRLAGSNLDLKIVSGQRCLNRKITVTEVNRPGLALTGHLENFRSERIQIIGKGEHAYCSKENAENLSKNLSKMLSRSNTPCIIITGGLRALEVIKKVCTQHHIPLLTTKLDTPTFTGELTTFLDNQLSPVVYVHGVLVNVYGLGVLIQGESGIGKSECALELLKRNHILIADDVVEIRRKRGQILVGVCPENLKHYMEVRGIGIIDVELLFGVGSIMDQSVVEMQVTLASCEKMYKCERIGLEQSKIDILDIQVPSLNIPVTPGRNLAVIIEVAALNQRLMTQGYFAARNFNNMLVKKMRNAGGCPKT